MTTQTQINTMNNIEQKKLNKLVEDARQENINDFAYYNKCLETKKRLQDLKSQQKEELTKKISEPTN